ncbi:MAG: sulfite exporter TauE/SafE family protein [Clostridiales bacterium]|nr:sulfite exporter TauE/SafE family protein [Clostridiales bacterium]
MGRIKVKVTPNIDSGGIELLVKSSVKQKCRKGKKNIFLKLLTGAFIGFINGFWGGGGGMVCVPLLTHVIMLPEKKAHATTLLIMLPLSIASLVVYIYGGNMQWWNALKIGLGFVVGGYVGALLLKKISNVWLCAIFSIVIIVGGLKLIL